MFEEHDWIGLEAIAKFLLEFDSLTMIVQGDQVLVSEALQVVSRFKELLLDKVDDHPLIKSMKRSMRQHLQSHRTKLARILKYLEPTSLAVYCAVLDPRPHFRNLEVYATDLKKETVKSNFIAYATKVTKKWLHRHDAEFRDKRARPSEDGASSTDDDSPFDPETTIIAIELKTFKRLARNWKPPQSNSRLDETKAVFDWWRSNAVAMPHLKIVAATLFSVRMTSASVERLFSFTGLVRTARRNGMSASLFDALVSYAYNDKQLQDDRAFKVEFRARKPASK